MIVIVHSSGSAARTKPHSIANNISIGLRATFRPTYRPSMHHASSNASRPGWHRSGILGDLATERRGLISKRRPFLDDLKGHQRASTGQLRNLIFLVGPNSKITYASRPRLRGSLGLGGMLSTTIVTASDHIERPEIGRRRPRQSRSIPRCQSTHEAEGFLGKCRLNMVRLGQDRSR